MSIFTRTLITQLRSYNGRALRQDVPNDADVACLDLAEGDLILLFTDGASNAVSPFEAKTRNNGEVSLTAHPFTDPEQIANLIAREAFTKSRIEIGYKSPFGAEYRRMLGSVHLGGKMDDITCVACWVVADEDLPSLLDQVQQQRRQRREGGGSQRSTEKANFHRHDDYFAQSSSSWWEENSQTQLDFMTRACLSIGTSLS
jgi:hypothetical protein